MTKAERERYSQLVLRATSQFGLGVADLDTLLKCERTLHRWAERECGDGSNWAIERDDDTGKPFNVYHGEGEPFRYAIPDRERGALKRAQAVIAQYPELAIYHQTDPRGCALYIYRSADLVERICAWPGEVVRRDINSCYSSIGLAVSL